MKNYKLIYLTKEGDELETKEITAKNKKEAKELAKKVLANSMLNDLHKIEIITIKNSNKMKTNAKEIKEKIRLHILESVQDYEENEFTTAKEAATHVYNEFIRVERLDTFKSFYDYIFGLPFDFYF